MKTKTDFLKEYIRYRKCWMNEYSGDFKGDTIKLLEDCKEYAILLGIKWDNNYLDELDWERINRNDD